MLLRIARWLHRRLCPHADTWEGEVPGWGSTRRCVDCGQVWRMHSYHRGWLDERGMATVIRLYPEDGPVTRRQAAAMVREMWRPSLPEGDGTLPGGWHGLLCECDRCRHVRGLPPLPSPIQVPRKGQ